MKWYFYRSPVVNLDLFNYILLGLILVIFDFKECKMKTTSRRVAIVTGGGKGIGKAISTQLANKGVSVSLWDRNYEVSHEAVREIRKNGGIGLACVGDVTDEQVMNTFIEKTRDELGTPTILVNNAATSYPISFEEINQFHLTDLFNKNVLSPFLCIKAVVGGMIENNWGRIINISSSSFQTGAPMMAHYISSKGGLVGLTRALAFELGSRGVTANVVAPGFVDTPMLRRNPFNVDEVAQRLPVKRMGEPEDIAAACVYLASEEAGYITGQTISLNGGRSFS